MEYNSGRSQISNFKSAERETRGRLEITSLITPKLCDTKSYNELMTLIVSITKCENLSVGKFINVNKSH